MPALEFLEDLAGHLDPAGLPLDADLAVAGDHLHAEGVADLAEELVAAAEDGQLLVVAVERDRDFRHALPFDGLGFARTVAQSCNQVPGRPNDSPIMGTDREKTQRRLAGRGRNSRSGTIQYAGGRLRGSRGNRSVFTDSIVARSAAVLSTDGRPGRRGSLVSPRVGCLQLPDLRGPDRVRIHRIRHDGVRADGFETSLDGAGPGRPDRARGEPPGADDKIDGDLKAIQGKWSAKIGERRQGTYTVEGKKLKVVAPSRTYEITMTLDPEAKPEKTLDLKIDEAPDDAKGKTSKGIYKLDGEKFIFCFAPAGRPARPSSRRKATRRSLDDLTRDKD